MKKKILGVCFCLLAMASMSMAAATHDSIIKVGYFSNEEDPFEWLADHLGVSSDDLFDPLFLGMMNFLGPDSFIAPSFQEATSKDLEFQWDYLVLYAENSDEWYLFADDYNGADGLLTTPAQGIDDFNMSGAFFDTAFGFAAPAPVPEPGSLLLLGSGVIGLGLVVKRRINK